MVVIQNTEAVNIIRDQAGLSLKEGFPQNLAMTVQPVLDMTPDFHKFTSIFKSATGSTSSSTNTIYTVAGKRFLLTGLTYSWAKDAACDSATGAFGISATIDNVSTPLLRVGGIALTAQQGSVYVEFKRPVFCPIGTTIFMQQSTFTAGVFIRSAVLHGYELDAQL